MYEKLISLVTSLTRPISLTKGKLDYVNTHRTYIISVFVIRIAIYVHLRTPNSICSVHAARFCLFLIVIHVKQLFVRLGRTQEKKIVIKALIGSVILRSTTYMSNGSDYLLGLPARDARSRYIK